MLIDKIIIWRYNVGMQIDFLWNQSYLLDLMRSKKLVYFFANLPSYSYNSSILFDSFLNTFINLLRLGHFIDGHPLLLINPKSIILRNVLAIQIS